jgi:hypothetical protein
VTTNPGSLRDLLRDVRGGAPRRSPTVRVLAAFADHGDCNLATLAFAAGVDTDRLLAKTDYEAPFGQSPFAFARGLAFERMIGAASNYGPTLRLLRENMGFPVTDARVVNLRDSYPRNSAGMRLRAHDTRALLSQILHVDHDAPNLIDGAVLETRVGVSRHGSRPTRSPPASAACSTLARSRAFRSLTAAPSRTSSPPPSTRSRSTSCSPSRRWSPSAAIPTWSPPRRC